MREDEPFEILKYSSKDLKGKCGFKLIFRSFSVEQMPLYWMFNLNTFLKIFEIESDHDHDEVDVNW